MRKKHYRDSDEPIIINVDSTVKTTYGNQECQSWDTVRTFKAVREEIKEENPEYFKFLNKRRRFRKKIPPLIFN